MKRKLSLAAFLAALLAAAPVLPAQDNRAEAERKEAEERHLNITSRLEKLEESIAAHQKSVNTLTDEVRKLKDELDRFRHKNDGAATQDGLKRLQDAIIEVDKKRASDTGSTRELMAKQFAELQKLILEKPIRQPGNSSANANPGSTPPPPTNDSKPKPAIPNRGYKYSIRSGDTLSGLVKALKKEGHKVTEKIIMDANPGVNWDKLRINQEIFIPETR